MNKKIFQIIILLLILTCAGCNKEEKKKEDGVRFKSLEDFNKTTIAVQSGTVFDKIFDKNLENTKYKYYNDITSQIESVKKGETDATGLDEPVARMYAAADKNLAIFATPVQTDTYGFGLKKDGKYTEKISKTIKELKEDGSLDKLKERWLSSEGSNLTIDWDKYSYEGEGTLRYYHDSTLVPMSFLGADNKSAGYEVETVLMIAKKLNMNVKIVPTNFDSLIPAIISGKADIVSGCISITDERKENIDFPESHYQGGIVLLTRREDSISHKCVAYDLDSYEGKEIGILTGSVFDKSVTAVLKDPKLKYFNSVPDMMMALLAGNIDAYAADEPTAIYSTSDDERLVYVEEKICKENYAFAFQKNDKGKKLCKEMNEFLEKLGQSGEKKRLQDKWLSGDENNMDIPDYKDFKGENGTLRYVTCSELPPFDFVMNNEVVGYEIEIFIEFCKEYGYKPSITSTDFSQVISGLVTDKYNIAGSFLAVTDERKENVLFSDPDYDGGTVFVTKDKGEQIQESILVKISDSFNKTFVRENRWKMFINGIVVTLNISVAACIFGTLFGFGLCFLGMRKHIVPRGISRTIISVVQGIPVLVILMILYYIIFKNDGIKDEFIAIIGFSINFGVYVSEMLKSGIKAVDKGQSEAAYSMGYSKPRAFFKIILPQAARHFLPIYRGELISMLKMTSVVGYIAIQDLTKVSDIVRSRTFEAFFPLISSAIMYFVLSRLFTIIINRIEKQLDPERKKRHIACTQK